MQPITVSVGPLASANTTIIADAQTSNVAFDLVLQETVVVLDEPRQVQITSDGDETGVSFTVIGTTYSGQSVSEVIAGPNATTANSILDFASVTRVSTDGGLTGNASVGTTNVAHSRWVRLDSWAASQSAVQVSTDGTITYSVETTMDDPNSATNPVAPIDVNWVNALDTSLVSANATVSGYFAYTPTFARLAVADGNGTATMTIAQFSNAPY